MIDKMEMYEIFNNRRNSIEEILATDYLRLKSTGRAVGRLFSHYKKNSSFLSKNCKEFQSYEFFGTCKSLNCICPKSLCEYLDKCMEKCIERCIAKSKELIIYDEPPEEYNKAIDLCLLKIEQIANKVPAKDVINFLICRLEECVALCLSTEPMEIITIMIIREWMFKKYGDLRNYSFSENIENEEECTDIYHYFASYVYLKQKIVSIRSGDSVLIINSEGKKNIDTIAENPLLILENMKEFENKISSDEKNRIKIDYIQKEGLMWTSKMKDVFQWCITNDISLKPGGHSFRHQLQDINKHLIETGNHLRVNLSECFKLGFPMYSSLVDTISYWVTKKSWFKEIIDFYSNMTQKCQTLAETSFSPFFWDYFVAGIPSLYNDPFGRKFVPFFPSEGCYDYQHPMWPLDDGLLSLHWSTLFLGFAQKNSHIILTNPKIQGKWFEDVIADELLDRHIPIIDRNIELSDGLGDIDILAFDGFHYYIIETKAWGPRSKFGYFGSNDYSQRIQELHNEINKHSKRIEFIDKNRRIYNIPEMANLIGLFITGFEEIHLSYPSQIIGLSHSRICSIFGGEPAKPELKLHKSNIYLAQNYTEVKHNSDSGIQKNQLNESDSKVTELVIDLIVNKYGSIDAYHIYRAACEVSIAIEKDGFGVKELCILPTRRPNQLTKQYLTFLVYKADNIGLDRISNGMNILQEKQILAEKDGIIIIENIPKAEYWRVMNTNLISVSNKNDADLVLNDIQKNIYKENGICIIGLPPPFVRFSNSFTILDIREI